MPGSSWEITFLFQDQEQANKKKREEKREQTIARLEEELDKGNLNETENSHLEGEIKAKKH